ncbi:MerR family transcriptional regulator [Dactylosporangium sp. CA-233914]|uniref:MerR family transcriptional regulator n=1 Tax=Dactylosporangium sp. CA-233914 TaxID=3239934 RepID=UPI003D92F863
MKVVGRKRRWSVGELARASGLTVRALHYYGEIGLVSASERTPAGHRRYTDPDVRRLYRLRALHLLGLPLEEIRTVLNTADDSAALRQILVAQLADLDARAAGIAELRGRIQALLEQVDGSGMPGSGSFLTVLEATVPLVHANAYLTPQQREAVVQHARELGDDTITVLKAEWLGLVEQLRTLLRDGVAAGDPRVRALAGRWTEIGTALRGTTGDDGRLNTALAAMWRDNRTVIDQGMADRVAWLDAGDVAAVVEYVQQARQLGEYDERTVGDHG